MTYTDSFRTTPHQVYGNRDPDGGAVILFRHMPVKNELETAKAGRPIFDDVEVCDVRFPGSRNYGTYPALAHAGWMQDPYTGEQRAITYAEKYNRQYQQFKAQLQQTKRGTPLSEAPFVTAGKCAELRAQNLYTVEALAAIEGSELKNLGIGGRELKNAAIEYMDHARRIAPDTQMAAKMEAAEARMKILEEDNAILKNKLASGEAQFEAMSIEELRAYVTTQTGAAPHGSNNKKTLIRMAMNHRAGGAAGSAEAETQG